MLRCSNPSGLNGTPETLERYLGPSGFGQEASVKLSSIDYQRAQERYAFAAERWSVALSILVVVALNLVGWTGLVLATKSLTG